LLIAADTLYKAHVEREIIDKTFNVYIRLLYKILLGGREDMKGSKLTLISLKIPMALLKEVDELVAQGIFASRSEAIREALKLLLSRYK
jgi:Predicted transcriptional regulators containing the CopG/Arc/MetJ DNA-binding domain and a metal-binding domain